MALLIPKQNPADLASLMSIVSLPVADVRLEKHT